LLGQVVSITGDWLASIALLVFVYQRTGSGLAVGALRGRVFGMLTATSNLTSMVSMAAGGALADIIGIREVYALAGLVIVAGGVAALGVTIDRSHSGGVV
jgi:MFS family permease